VKLSVWFDLDQLRILCLVFLYCEDELLMCDVGLQNLNQESRRGCFIAVVIHGKTGASTPQYAA
jgi:hypothetical protein